MNDFIGKVIVATTIGYITLQIIKAFETEPKAVFVILCWIVVVGFMVATFDEFVRFVTRSNKW